DAVALGADFYDGNGDEVYNPVDLNGNNQWDPDEDMPDLLGDETAWCVYWDGQPAAQRLRFAGVEPQGIEIRQTMFAIDTTSEEGNIIFLRYRISNSGLVSERLDSVIFSVWADPDLGEEFDDDLVGVDVSRNAGFTYNGDDNDPVYGSQIPSFFMDFLSGPAAYIPGETFVDIDGNGIYTPGIDTPLDTAYTFRGQLLGIKELPGAKNLDISSFVHYIQSDPLRGDPNDEFEARNYGLGRLKFGEFLDPCNDTWGGVFGGVDCSTVDPLFWYSGDPVTNVGWINTGPTDQRHMTNVGPFTLRQDEEIEVLVAYVVGQGSDRLNSITVARNISDIAQSIYDSNFDFPVSVEDETPNLPTEFSLAQNYPNPFNPSTTIKFSLPSSSYTTLKVYNALGEEIVVLLDKEFTAGIYEVEWNANGLPSGVYFYQLQTAGYVETKKMLLLK
ncbi:T9SS type A sorting domain-containing protein, partial [Bacteroidota bacterium]